MVYAYKSVFPDRHSRSYLCDGVMLLSKSVGPAGPEFHITTVKDAARIGAEPIACKRAQITSSYKHTRGTRLPPSPKAIGYLACRALWLPKCMLCEAGDGAITWN
jgi:hypothetical protein